MVTLLKEVAAQVEDLHGVVDVVSGRCPPEIGLNLWLAATREA